MKPRHDSVIRTVADPRGKRVTLTLHGEAVVKLREAARARLTRLLGDVAFRRAVTATRGVAEKIAGVIEGLSGGAANLSALFLLANEDLQPRLPPDLRRRLDLFQGSYGEGVINELSAFCQLTDFPEFFAEANLSVLEAYLHRHVFGDDADQNVMINECILRLDENP